MKNPIVAVQEHRDRIFWEQWDREHRWDRLATYNAEVGRGIVHTPEYDAEMAKQQAAFHEEQRQCYEHSRPTS